MHSPADAIRHGVGMLHQDPLDFPPMRVVDNLLIGAPGRLVPRRAEAAKAVADLAGSLGLSIDLKADVESLTVGERQQLELLRLLWLGARVLILDEPTTGISATQREQLFATLRRLAAQGKTVLFVSHKLEEVQELCTRVAVLRQGRLIGEALPPFQVDRLVSMMFEREVSPGERVSCTPGESLFRLAGMSAEHGRIKLDPVDLDVRRGETIGLAGMEGSGQSRVPARLRGTGPHHRRPHLPGGHRPGRQELSPVQEEGDRLRARLQAGGGPDTRAYRSPTISSSPRGSRACSSTGRAAAGWRRSASPSTTSRARRPARWSRSPAATSNGRCWPSSGRAPRSCCWSSPRGGWTSNRSSTCGPSSRSAATREERSSSRPATWTSSCATATASWCSSPGKVSGPLDAASTTVDQLGHLIGGRDIGGGAVGGPDV